jgi:endonuclease YncB( thermonuclease family)
MVGKLLDVQDGDSFRIIVRDGTPMHIRIAGIDAPERGQPFADESRAALRTLLARRSLHIRVLTTDRFGRLVADVDNGERDVGLAQVHAGLAWHFKRFAPTQPPPRRISFAYAEQQARQLRLGLWQQATPQTPWEHRSHRRGVYQEIP